jgi:hypothetical protein
VRIAIHASEHQHAACPGGQCCDRRLDIEVAARLVGRRIGNALERIIDRRVHAGFLAAPPALRQHGVDGDPMQPGAEAAAFLEARQRAPSLDEGLLCTVFGALPIRGHAQTQSMDPAHVHAIQRFERHLGARLCCCHPRPLVGVAARAVEIDYGGRLGQDHTSEDPGPVGRRAILPVAGRLAGTKGRASTFEMHR